MVLLYANSLSGDLVFDSRLLVLEDPRLRAVSFEHLGQIFSHTYWWPNFEFGLYRPATTLSFLLNYSVLGNATAPRGYHLVNVALHATNVCLLYWCTRSVLGRVWPAMFGAALWAAHPLVTEAVSNIAGRSDLLATLGVLAAFHAHLRVRSSSGSTRIGWLAALALAAFIAATAKESGVVVVGVIVLYDLTVNGWRGSHRWMSWTAAAVPVGLFLVVRSTVLATTPALVFPFVDNPMLGAGVVQGRLTALAVAGRYLWLSLWPDALSADYSFSQIALATGASVEFAAWCLVAAAIAVTWVVARSHRPAFFLLLTAALAFLPVSNLLFTTGTIMGERLFYLPLGFLCAAFVVGVTALQQATGVRHLAPAVCGVLIVAAGARTIARNQDWRNELALWSATVEAAPRSFKAHSGFAEALYNADPSHSNLTRVVAEKEISLALLEGVPHPEEVSLQYREAATYALELGDLLSKTPETSAAATRAYQRSVELTTRYLSLADVKPVSPTERASAELMLATANERLKNGDAAITAARTALSREPFNPLGYRALASAQFSAQQADAAATTLMTGFMLTGQAELRLALFELYRAGLDTKQCAITASASGPALNPDCALVRTHLCAGAAAAARAQRQAGRNDLATQIEQSMGNRCTP